MRRWALGLVGWAAASTAADTTTTTLTMADKTAWSFVGGSWKEATPTPATGSRPWL